MLPLPPILAALVAAAMTPAPVQADPNTPALDAILAEAAAECAGFDNGLFGTEDFALSHVDLTGDGTPDVVIDYQGFTCTGAASLWSGTGGGPLVFLIDGQRYDAFARGWQIADVLRTTVLVLALHGSECGGIGAEPCFEALTWTGEGFASIRSQTAPEAGAAAE